MATTLNPRMIDSSVIFEIDRAKVRSLDVKGLSAESLSAIDIQTNRLDSVNLTAVNLTATNIKAFDTQVINLTAFGNVASFMYVLSTNSNVLFNDSYNSKIIHIGTTTSTTVTAIFPSSITNGFNVSIINAGTGNILVSAEGGLNAPGTLNASPYTGMFIYKVNNQFFGIGAFE